MCIDGCTLSITGINANCTDTDTDTDTDTEQLNILHSITYDLFPVNIHVHMLQSITVKRCYLSLYVLAESFGSPLF